MTKLDRPLEHLRPRHHAYMPESHAFNNRRTLVIVIAVVVAAASLMMYASRATAAEPGAPVAVANSGAIR